jgi:hypothetical protein
MPAKVQLKDLVDALDMQMDEHSTFLDLDTGQVESVSNELLSAAEEGEDEPHLPEWQQPEWELAKRIAAAGRFEALPTKFDIHEWGIMEEFADTVKSGPVREDVTRALHGSGAFRRFKDTVRRHGIEDTWFAFRTEALRQIAIEWCEEHQIDWQ